MSEPVKRNSTRERKPNRFHLLEESEGMKYSGGLVADQREIRPNTSQTHQIAKLLLSFIHSINTRCRDYDHRPNNQQSEPHPQPYPHHTPPTHRGNRSSERLPTPADLPASQSARRGGDRRRTGDEEGGKTNSKGAEKKRGDVGKQNNLLNGHLDQDFTTLAANAARNKPNTQPEHNHSQPHSKSNPPKHQERANPNPNPTQRLRVQQEEKKKAVTVVEGRGQQLKPFKRQSYHVAIAYHIHVKNVRSSSHSNTNEIDPTYKARKLRDQQERQ